jgi:hypothetical protein
VAGLVASGPFPVEREGGAAVTPKGGVGPQNSCSGGGSSGGALVLAPILLNFVTPLGKGLKILELPLVDKSLI